jgi:hypothetical protein
MEPALVGAAGGGARVLAATRSGIGAAALDTKAWTMTVESGVVIAGAAGNPTAVTLDDGSQVLLLTRFLDGRDPRW